MPNQAVARLPHEHSPQSPNENRLPQVVVSVDEVDTRAKMQRGVDVGLDVNQADPANARLIVVPLLLVVAGVGRLLSNPMQRGGVLAVAGAAGVIFLATQGLAIGFNGWNWTISETLFGPLAMVSIFGGFVALIVLLITSLVRSSVKSQ